MNFDNVNQNVDSEKLIVDLLKQFLYKEKTSDFVFEKQITEEIRELAIRHKVYPVISSLSRSFRDDSHKDCKINELKHLLRLKLCRELISKLDEKNIPYAFLKGVVLAKRAYGDIGLRSSNDIDLLVRYSDLHRINKILFDLEFYQNTPEDKKFSRKENIFYLMNSHQTPSYHKRTNIPVMPVLTLDINFSVFWGESRNKSLGLVDIFLEHREKLDINQESITTLDTEYFFIQLCLHHYKDLNSFFLLIEKNTFQLRYFCDIYYYLYFNQEKMDIDKLSHLMEKYNLRDYIYYMIYYSIQLFGNFEFMEKLFKIIETSNSEFIISHYGLGESEKKLWKNSFYGRLFNNNLGEEIRENLSEAEINKVKLNSQYFS